MINLKKYNSVSNEMIYSTVLNEIAKENFFKVLTNELSYLEFHKKLIQLAEQNRGVGIAVSVMAQVNISGKVLSILSEKNEYAKYLLDSILDGSKTVSLGVSEPNWKGKISNLSSCIDENLILNAEKSFFTNGANSSEFILVVKKNSEYKLVILEKKDISNFVENFSLDFAIEATHSRIKLENFQLKKEQIFDFNYRNYSENLRLSEILSLNAIFIGYIKNMILNLKKDFLDFEEIKLYKILFFLEIFENRILEINSKRDKNEKLDLREFYPFGLEFFREEIYFLLKEVFSIELVEKWDTEKKLFLMRDLFTEILLKKKAKKIIYTLEE